jgi:hypothetical protein
MDIRKISFATLEDLGCTVEEGDDGIVRVTTPVGAVWDFTSPLLKKPAPVKTRAPKDG